MSNSFSFNAEVWDYNGENSWHFVTLPQAVADALKQMNDSRHGFGTIQVIAVIGGTKWQTSLFPDTKSDSYLLPVKKEVQVAESLIVGTSASVQLFPLLV